jgi:endo-1,4-beta-D-glucanase Y
MRHAWYIGLSALWMLGASPVGLSAPPHVPRLALSVAPTRIPNSVRVTATATGLSSGDVVDVQIYNRRTGSLIQQFYRTAAGPAVSLVSVSEALPPSTAVACRLAVYRPNWATRIIAVDNLDPWTTGPVRPTLIDQAAAYYADWRRSYVIPAPVGLRVVNPFDHGDTVSEGQGYGLVIAALAHDAATFHGLWAYARQYLDAHGLMNWAIGPGGAVVGRTSATNGDQAMAAALLIAAREWPHQGYGAAGQAMAHAILAHDLIPHTHLIGPGDGWSAHNTTVAPGYFAPALYRLLAEATGQSAWLTVLGATAAWLERTGSNPVTGLVPDWETVSGHAVVPPGSQNPAEADDYDENAVPYALWLGAWAKAGGTSPLLARLRRFFLTAPPSDGYTLAGHPLGTGYVNLPYLATTAAFLMETAPAAPKTRRLWARMLAQQANSYYGATLKALALWIVARPPASVAVPPGASRPRAHP